RRRRGPAPKAHRGRPPRGRTPTAHTTAACIPRRSGAAVARPGRPARRTIAGAGRAGAGARRGTAALAPTGTAPAAAGRRLAARRTGLAWRHLHVQGGETGDGGSPAREITGRRPASRLP